MKLPVPPALVSYHAATEAFRQGKDTPRDFLERAIERLYAVEPVLHAFAVLALPRARIAADAAGARWKAGNPLSPIDGMPVGIKDIIETFDMPMELGSPTATGYQPMRDAATVFALREAGAAVFGKTKTTEYANGYATDTRNPYDPARTSGGSSAGSAASVGAGILPFALGTQVIGSVLRPASFCGAFAFKPTLGGFNRGGSHDFQSHSCIGVIGASLADIWHGSYEMVRRAGGDPGAVGLIGGASLAQPAKPKKLIKLETEGWDAASDAVRQQFEDKLAAFSKAGVAIVTRKSDPEVDAFERAIDGLAVFARDLIAFEGWWPNKPIAYRDRMGLSPMQLDTIARAEQIGLEGYRELLKQRARLRADFEALAAKADGFVTLGAPGAAPLGIKWSGNPAFNVPASVLGAPALTLPVLNDGGLPVGLQVMGPQHSDEQMFALAGWALAN